MARLKIDTQTGRIIPNNPGARLYRNTRDWQRRRAAQKARQPWCSHCGATTDLTADHVHALSNGGDPHGPLDTLCRTCNALKHVGGQ